MTLHAAVHISIAKFSFGNHKIVFIHGLPSRVYDEKPDIWFLGNCPGLEERLTNDRDVEWRTRYVLGNHQQEDGEGEKYRDPERDLLPAIWRQTEDYEDEDGEEDAGQDDVRHVERAASVT